MVKPETISNSESIKRGISPEITKGNEPIRLIKIQLAAVQTKPSLAVRRLALLRERSLNATYRATAMPMVIAKPKTAFA